MNGYSAGIVFKASIRPVFTYLYDNKTKTLVREYRPMTYGIVRNNLYKIVITGVSGIGDSEITPDIMHNNYPHSYIDVESE